MSLPSISLAEVKSNNTKKSCYVTIGNKVFDVTDFMEDHPGGGDLILDHAGTDVTEILTDELSHAHTEAAYEILDECLIGYLPAEPFSNGNGKLNGSANGQTKAYTNGSIQGNGAKELLDEQGRTVYETTGMSSADDLSKDTDVANDYKTHKFLDLNKPLLLQVWFGGFDKKFYLEQVHRPRHYKGGASAPLFGNFLEPLSLTPWWMVPTIWLPAVAFTTYKASEGLSNLELAGYWILGLWFWTLIEYGLHRCLFHLDDHLPNNRVGITLHFLMHGIHHYLPMDKYRLVMPPTLFILLATPFWYLAHTIFFYNWHAAIAAYAGGVLGYVCYDLTHYFLHHRNLPSYYRELKKYHLTHHFADYENGFGVTSRFWDRVFGTELQMPQPKVLKTT